MSRRARARAAAIDAKRLSLLGGIPDEADADDEDLDDDGSSSVDYEQFCAYEVPSRVNMEGTTA